MFSSFIIPKYIQSRCLNIAWGQIPAVLQLVWIKMLQLKPGGKPAVQHSFTKTLQNKFIFCCLFFLNIRPSLAEVLYMMVKAVVPPFAKQLSLWSSAHPYWCLIGLSVLPSLLTTVCVCVWFSLFPCRLRVAVSAGSGAALPISADGEPELQHPGGRCRGPAEPQRGTVDRECGVGEDTARSHRDTPPPTVAVFHLLYWWLTFL